MPRRPLPYSAAVSRHNSRHGAAKTILPSCARAVDFHYLLWSGSAPESAPVIYSSVYVFAAGGIEARCFRRRANSRRKHALSLARPHTHPSLPPGTHPGSVRLCVKKGAQVRRPETQVDVRCGHQPWCHSAHAVVHDWLRLLLACCAAAAAAAVSRHTYSLYSTASPTTNVAAATVVLLALWFQSRGPEACFAAADSLASVAADVR